MAAQQAEALEKKARKATETRLFKWKPDFDLAAAHYEEAAGVWKGARQPARAKLAHEHAAEAHEQLGNPWSAARQLEASAACAKDAGEGVQQVVDLWRRASQCYAEAGRGQRAAEALAAGGRAVQDASPEFASALFLDAVEIFEEEDKHAYAGDAFRSAVALHLKAKRPADAVATLLRFAQSCEKAGQTASLAKAYVSAVLVWLDAGDAAEAEMTYADIAEVPAFSRSDEAAAAWQLLDAVRDGDAAALKAAVKKNHCLDHLDQAFVRIARGLPSPGTDLAAMSAQLKKGGGVTEDEFPRGGGDDDEDDLT